MTAENRNEPKKEFRRYSGEDPSFGPVQTTFVCLAFATVIASMGVWFSHPPRHWITDSPNNEPTPNEVETRKQLLSALKDPAMTDRIIEQIKIMPLTQELLADPDIMKNMRKLVSTFPSVPI